MLRFAVLLALISLVASSARANGMDPTLGRLRLAAGRGGCPTSIPGGFCPDQELFERLVSELSVAMAPAVTAAAHSEGPRALRLGFDMTITSVEAAQAYWALGTEGTAGSSVNASPAGALVWNRLSVRKGLPFGFEVGASLGQGAGTSIWNLGVALKWALFEGFRSGIGSLPDVSVQGSFSRSVGSSQLSVSQGAIDLTLSKPFVIGRAFALAPLGGMQALITRVESGVVDLTPGGPNDAYASCMPVPGDQPASPTCAASGNGADFSSNVVFRPVTQTRVRPFLGAQGRYASLVMSVTGLFDLLAPALAATPVRIASPNVARQVAINFAVGVVL
ncbi:MAG: hypothetical protein ACHQ53_00525 [Polyangiales bacterium]